MMSKTVCMKCIIFSFGTSSSVVFGQFIRKKIWFQLQISSFVRGRLEFYDVYTYRPEIPGTQVF
jgi:hypothetical protein